MSSLELSKSEKEDERLEGQRGENREAKEGNEMRGREKLRPGERGGMVRKAELSKRKREWIVNVRRKQSDGLRWN